MDQITKLFLVMLLGSMLAGALVVVFNPRYRPERILRSNAHYFPETPAAVHPATQFLPDDPKRIVQP